MSEHDSRPTFEYKQGDPDQPINIIRHTNENLNLLFSPEIGSTPDIQEYFEKKTLGLIDKMNQGARIYAHASERTGNRYLARLRAVTTHSSSAFSLDQNFLSIAEAYDTGLAIFSNITSDYGEILKHFGVDSSQNIRPPYTVEDYQKRVAELYVFTNNILDGSRDALVNNPAAWRARSFFTRGSQMPLDHKNRTLDDLFDTTV